MNEELALLFFWMGIIATITMCFSLFIIGDAKKAMNNTFFKMAMASSVGLLGSACVMFFTVVIEKINYYV